VVQFPTAYHGAQGHFAERGHDAILQVSTHAGNAVSMIAGLVTLKHLTIQAIKNRVSKFKKLQKGFNKAFTKAGLKAQVTGIGHGFSFHMTDKPIRNPRDSFMAAMASEEIAGLIFMGLRYHGVAVYPPLFGIVSTAIGEEEVKYAIDALEKTLEDIAPLIAGSAPHLLL
jgi:glutamate-1-semialdehyde 2,1-aminomutase